MTFRPGTVVRTRGGWPVEIIAVLSTEQQDSDGYCIIGVLVQDDGATREIQTWHRDGTFRKPLSYRSPLDLELPQSAAVTHAEYRRMTAREFSKAGADA